MTKKNTPELNKKNKKNDYKTEDVKHFIRKKELQNQILKKSLKVLINKPKN